jgi:hypothetical protein
MFHYDDILKRISLSFKFDNLNKDTFLKNLEKETWENNFNNSTLFHNFEKNERKFKLKITFNF